MTDEQSKAKEEHDQALKKMFDSWTETLNWIQNRTPGIPAIGPAAGLARNTVTINAELAQAMQTLAEFNKYLAQYYTKISTTWMEATKKVMAESPADISEEKARERLRNIWIETFEQEFTTLFDSKDFAEIFGQMLKSEVNFNKHVRNLVEILSTDIGVPSRSEMDSVYKEIEMIKNKLKEIYDSLRDLKETKDDATKGSR
ncbi:MAG: poly(R)-hydroxyalkanoic acid synthase subunit PhaE [Nitrososphaerales archaeon]